MAMGKGTCRVSYRYLLEIFLQKFYSSRWSKEQHPARERFFAFNHRGYLRPR
jgi:hypothetical protein